MGHECIILRETIGDNSRIKIIRYEKGAHAWIQAIVCPTRSCKLPVDPAVITRNINPKRMHPR